MSPEVYTRLRAGAMGLTGLVGLMYGVLVLVTGRPDVISHWILGALGLATALLIGGTAFTLRRGGIAQVTDELHQRESARAASFGYFSVLLCVYPGIAILLVRGDVDWSSGFAAMGALLAASYMLAFAWLTGRSG
ncbi:MAG: hypothetical protein AAGE18_01655 [Pseudomonadota bacterium]